MPEGIEKISLNIAIFITRFVAKLIDGIGR